jgi:hypothetical protein
LPKFARLSGSNEVPEQGDPDGRGSATFIIPAPTRLCYAILVTGIGPPTMAQLGRSGRGGADHVMLALTPPSSGRAGNVSGCVSAGASLLANLRRNPAAYYLNVLTRDFPNGALRGSLFVATDKPAPAAAAGAPRGVYVGRVAGTHAFIAVVVGHGRARAYVCDSHHRAVWLPAGGLRGAYVDLAGAHVQVTGSVGRSEADGTLTLPDGSRHAFRAFPAPRNGAAGLYRAVKTFNGYRYLAGWILLRGGAQRGEVVKLNININTPEVQVAPKLNPKAASVELPGAGTASVVRLGDSFAGKTTECESRRAGDPAGGAAGGRSWRPRPLSPGFRLR